MSGLADRLIVALDFPTPDEARALVRTLAGTTRFYKVGLELLYNGGLELVRELVRDGYYVFVDAKLHDIPTTVAQATRQIAALGATFLTVHAYPQTMAAAAEAASGTSLKILGVTVLTSMAEEDAVAAGYTKPIPDIVKTRIKAAQAIGLGGVVCAGSEARAARIAFGQHGYVVTPGVRMPGEQIGDQRRITTPRDAARNGASHIVVGRPITRSDDPKAAALRMIENMGQGVQ